MSEENKRIEKNPLSIEQAHNYLKSKDFKRHSMDKFNNIVGDPILSMKDNQAKTQYTLRSGLSLLKKEGKELVYWQILMLRLKGATYGQISKAIREKVSIVKVLEKDAMRCVKDKIANRKILLPSVNKI